MPANISILDLFLQSSLLVKLVMLILLAMSIFSWAIIIKQVKFLSLVKIKKLEFEKKFWQSDDLSLIYKKVSQKKESIIGIEKIFYSGFNEFVRLHRHNITDPDIITQTSEQAMSISVDEQVSELEQNLPWLATIGSISPYVGLLGTVWGIMHSFIALGGVKQATLSMVAPGIAEALIATAIGLFTAIPAVVGFNRLTGKVSALENSYVKFAQEFQMILHRQTVISQLKITNDENINADVTNEIYDIN